MLHAQLVCPHVCVIMWREDTWEWLTVELWVGVFCRGTNHSIGGLWRCLEFHVQETPSPVAHRRVLKERFGVQVLLVVCTPVQPEDARDKFQNPTKSLHFLAYAPPFLKHPHQQCLFWSHSLWLCGCYEGSCVGSPHWLAISILFQMFPFKTVKRGSLCCCLICKD